jgi:hypothetical protein
VRYSYIRVIGGVPFVVVRFITISAGRRGCTETGWKEIKFYAPCITNVRTSYSTRMYVTRMGVRHLHRGCRRKLPKTNRKIRIYRTGMRCTTLLARGERTILRSRRFAVRSLGHDNSKWTIVFLVDNNCDDNIIRQMKLRDPESGIFRIIGWFDSTIICLLFVIIGPCSVAVATSHAVRRDHDRDNFN